MNSFRYKHILNGVKVPFGFEELAGSCPESRGVRDRCTAELQTVAGLSVD